MIFLYSARIVAPHWLLPPTSLGGGDVKASFSSYTSAAYFSLRLVLSSTVGLCPYRRGSAIWHCPCKGFLSSKGQHCCEILFHLRTIMHWFFSIRTFRNTRHFRTSVALVTRNPITQFDLISMQKVQLAKWYQFFTATIPSHKENVKAASQNNIEWI